MAETIKISALTEIPSGALDDNSVLPVVDGGVTYKLPVTKLKAFIGDSFATDAELSAQISSVNSTISGLTTTEVSEGSNQYYTNARVKNYIGVENVVSSSAQITNLGFYSGTTAIKNALPEGTISSSVQVSLASVTGNTTTNVTEGDNLYYTDVRVKDYINTQYVISGSQQITDFGFISSSTIPVGTVSSSQQITDFGFISESITELPLNLVSSSNQITEFGFITAAGASTAINLTVTGEYIKNRLPETTISSSQQITDFGFISESGVTPFGTISGSQQITDLGFISESGVATLPNNIVSSSAQIVLADANTTGYNTSLIPEGPPGTNLYFTNLRVFTLLESLNTFSGSINVFTSSINTFTSSIAAGSAPFGTISGSQQITDLGFISSSDVALPTGVVSGSSQVRALLPEGTVSSSFQVELFGFPIGSTVSSSIDNTILSTVTSQYVKNRLPENTVSASAQLSSTFALLDGATGVLNLSSSLATRVSVLEGSSGITDGLVSGSAQIDYLLTQNQLTFEGESITILQTGNKVELTGSVVTYANVTNKPLGIISGSTQILDLNYVNDNELNSPDGIKTLTVPDNTTISSFAATFLDDTTAEAVKITLGIPNDLAVTGSANVFDANQTINAQLTVTGETVMGQLTASSIIADSFVVGIAGTPIIESATNLDISASADINVFAQNMIVSSSVDIGDTLKLKSWNPLPAGELGMLAVSASAAGVGGLYFYNGTVWSSVDLT
jgi:hypothetical protein